ncbi:MAG: hypothetical protein L6Q98_19430 [Anaerolineae bacterium]|nr:hypothetical protein [Anaerolineae bacterium]NUQ05987.1 hypothetical protein [Anaerolineae bacterium]
MNRAPITRAATATGETPRVEVPAPQPLPLEVSDPPTEMPARRRPGATTGIMPVVIDIADPAKFADDDASEPAHR